MKSMRLIIITSCLLTLNTICDAGLEVKQKAIPIRKGHGQDYLNINVIYNNNNEWEKALQIW